MRKLKLKGIKTFAPAEVGFELSLSDPEIHAGRKVLPDSIRAQPLQALGMGFMSKKLCSSALCGWGW